MKTLFRTLAFVILLGAKPGDRTEDAMRRPLGRLVMAIALPTAYALGRADRFLLRRFGFTVFRRQKRLLDRRE